MVTPLIILPREAGAHGPLLSSQNSAAFAGGTGQLVQTTISYTYDSLYRLTDAVYSPSTGSGGFEFHYTYDPVGNRLTQTTCVPNIPCATTTYSYDDANRLIAVNGVAYTWDDAGNLLNDGTSMYSYDSQNRLIGVGGSGLGASYRYNGQGDRVSQTVNGVTTNYTLDLNTGLTQVLAANFQPPTPNAQTLYLYGRDRIAQTSNSETAYFLLDALGSVRQLVDTTGAVQLTKNYEPYGNVTASDGSGVSAFGYAGESQDAATGLTYLRARFYSSAQGRFISKDSWRGDEQQPASNNSWLYGYGNPVNLVDRSGQRPCSDWLMFANQMSEQYFPDKIRSVRARLFRENYKQCLSSPPDSSSLDTQYFDVRVDPWGINWFPSIDPLREGAGGIPKDRPGAQYEVYNDDGIYGTTDTNHYYKSRRWTELCGEVSLAAILRLSDNNLTARDVVEALISDKVTEGERENTANLTGPDTLANLVNTKYSENWYADVSKTVRTDYITVTGNDRYDWTLRKSSSVVGRTIKNWLESRKYAIVSVGIEGYYGKVETNPVLATRWTNQVNWQKTHPKEPIPQTSDYILCNSPVICHWVVITGISEEWNNTWDGNGASPWQWVRIYNPFSNHTEYYWWKDFYQSWAGVGGQMMLVEKRNAPVKPTSKKFSAGPPC